MSGNQSGQQQPVQTSGTDKATKPKPPKKVKQDKTTKSDWGAFDDDPTRMR